MKPVIGALSNELTNRISELARKRTFYEGEQVFAEGETADFLPIVVSGSVRMIHYLEPGKEVTIGTFHAGEMFAVPPVFDGKNYPSTAIATEQTELLLLPRAQFLALLADSSEFAFAVIGWMTSMLREKTAAIETLATASPEHRIAKILLKLAGDDGEFPVRIRLRREDIAKRAGLTTETTIRVIRRLAERGLLEIEHGKVVIHDAIGLTRLAES